MENELENKRKSCNKYYYNEKRHERLKEESRERYHKDPNYKKATLERAKNRYYEDAEYREATIRRAKERYHRLKKILAIVFTEEKSEISTDID